jgi:Mrp family chromosome partitioning ATPase
MLPVQRPELDAVYRQTVGKHVRTVCVTAANPCEGVSILALALARRGAAAGLRALLVDANLPQPSISARLGLRSICWSPADGSAREAVVPVEGSRLSVLPAPSAVDPFVLRDTDKWRRMLENDLAEYDLIVIDASPVNSFDEPSLPAEPIAAACAATVLVVLTGVTSEQCVRSAAERLTTAGASLCGAVFNDRYNHRLADELNRQVDRFAWFAPKMAGRLRRRINTSAMLNLQL